jgi:hypothetical protein
MAGNSCLAIAECTVSAKEAGHTGIDEMGNQIFFDP